MASFIKWFIHQFLHFIDLITIVFIGRDCAYIFVHLSKEWFEGSLIPDGYKAKKRSLKTKLNSSWPDACHQYLSYVDWDNEKDLSKLFDFAAENAVELP